MTTWKRRHRKDLCHRCTSNGRLCERICPSGAIKSKKNTRNSWFVSNTRAGKMTHALMGPGEENSGKLVTRVRQKAKELAVENGAGLVLIDGPPGTGCATIASLTGADLVLVVMEPSITSLHDATRVMKLVQGFGIPACAIINKHNLNTRTCMQIEDYLQQNSVQLLGKIPFDERIVLAMIKGKSICESEPKSDSSTTLISIWEQLTELPVKKLR